MSAGAYTTAESGYETALGRYNTDYTPNTTIGWNDNDRLFVIGNGTGSGSRSDALIVMKSGDVYFNGDSYLSGEGHFTGETSFDDDIFVTHSNSSSTGGIHVVNTAAPAQTWRLYTSSSTGDLRFHSDDNGGSATAWINDVTGAYSSISDRRFKKNLEPIKSVLGDIMASEPMRYHYKLQDNTEEKSLGFIAQEVKEIFPELVSEEEDRYGVNYDGFGVLAIKAIQELNTKVEDQALIIKEQQRLLNELYEMVRTSQTADD
jgi:hypothetical protein